MSITGIFLIAIQLKNYHRVAMLYSLRCCSMSWMTPFSKIRQIPKTANH